jgi:hypothetical protein
MKHGPPLLARLMACGALLLGLTLVAGCGDDKPTPPPETRQVPDAEKSTVVVNPARGARANGRDPVDIRVTVLQADGSPLAGRTVTVAASGEGNTLQQPSGPTNDQGEASARLTSTRAGTKTVTVTVSAEGGDVTLAARPTAEFSQVTAARLAFTEVPGPGTAGERLGTFEVSLQDESGATLEGATDTVTVALGDNPTGDTLQGTLSVAADHGVARFSTLVLHKASSGYSLVASAPGLPDEKSPAFTVRAAAPRAFALTATPASQAAGSPVSLTVGATDAFGNPVSTYTGSVHFTSADAKATLPGDYTFGAADAGRHEFPNAVTLRTAGSQRVVVRDVADATREGSVEVVVLPGGAEKLVFTQSPANASVRAPFGVQVAVTDAQGNRLSTASATVKLTLDKGGTLAGSTSVATADGLAAFTGLSIAEENTGYTLTASAPGLAAAVSGPFTIVDDVPPAVPVLTQSASTANSVTVAWTAVGDDGGAGTVSGHDLRYASTDITSDATFDAATKVTLGAPKAGGSAESAVITGLSQGRTYYVALQVSDNAGHVVRSATRMVSTQALNATQLAFSVQPQSGTAGVVLAPLRVEIRDAAGALVDSATSAVTLSVVGMPAIGPFTVAAVKGVATFEAVRIDVAGKGYKLQATAGSLTPATSTAFDIAPAAAASLALSGLPAQVTAGSSQTLTVEARDAFANVATGYTGTVHFTSTDAAALLPADATFSAADAGRKSVSVTLKTVGDQSVTVRDVARTTLSATASTTVALGTPSKLVFQSQPGNGTVRSALASVSVAITDAAGNVLSVGSPDISVHLVGGNAAAVLAGTTTATPSSGVATFSSLTVDQQGTGFKLEATGGSLTGATSAPFNIVDNLAPDAAVLRVEGTVTSTLVPLAWTAVGDDGTLGLAFSYDLRYATSPIDAASFEAATAVLTDPPLPPGSAESLNVTGLTPNTRYYFALRVLDDAGNASSLAFASATTRADPCAGFSCTPRAASCGADGVSRVTYTAACVDENNAPVCQQTESVTACAGTNAVCYQAACTTAAPPANNQLAFSELMHSPTGSTTEYFELTNTTSALLNLNGVSVTYRNGGSVTRSFQVGSGAVPVLVAPRGTFVLAHDKNPATNGGVPADYQYPDAIVLDGSGQFSLSVGDTPVTDFLYTSAFPQTPGKAMNLASAVVGTFADASSWYWCDSTQALPGGNLGSPNAPNDTCGVAASPPVDFCNVQYPKTSPPLAPNTALTVYSRFYEPSVTNRNTAGNDGYPYVSAQLGYGPQGTSAETWTWKAISFNGEYSATVSNDDEMMGTLRIATPGAYQYAFRYAFREPASGTLSDWVYCDQNGVSPPSGGIFGTVTIEAPATPTTNHVVISEVASKNLAADGTVKHDDEFIELYNPTNAAVSLVGWKIQYKSSTSGSAFGDLGGFVFINTSIPAKGYFLVTQKTGYTGTVAPDATYTALTSHSGASLRLLNASGVEVDKLAWGTGAGLSPEGTAMTAPTDAQAAGSMERMAASTSTVGSMAPGGTDATRGNGYDTDNNSTNFLIRAAREPQNTSSAPESP